MTTTEMNTAVKQVEVFKDMVSCIPGSSMLRQVAYQYRDMANGGDGGAIGLEENGQTTCRGVNYLGYSDTFFQFVCDAMGWSWK